MKTYQYILTAAALVLGLAGCSEDALVQQPSNQPLVDVTIGANFATTRTSLAENGDILWSEGDKIKVTVGDNAYDFELKSGKGSVDAVFHAVVPAADAAILKGEAIGTVTAYYPTSGAEVPATQTYAEGTFADGTFPMVATNYENLKLTFTNTAAIVRIKGVSKAATSAVLSYTVNSQNYSVSMALTAGETAKNLYFVVVPGAQDFNLSLNGGAAVQYKASKVTEAGARYDIIAPVAKIGEKYYDSIEKAFAAAVDNDVVELTADLTQATGVLFDKNITATFDLNGKTFKVTNDTQNNHRAIKVTQGTLTVKNGVVDARNVNAQGEPTSIIADNFDGIYGAFRAENGTTLNLKDLTVYNNHFFGFSSKYSTGSTGEIDGCTFYSSYGGAVEAAGGVVTVKNSTVHQEGISTDADYDFIASGVGVSTDGVANVKDCQMNAQNAVFTTMTSGGTVNVNGGTYSSNDENGYVAQLFWSYSQDHSHDNFVNLQAGTFSGKFGFVGDGYEGTSHINVSGGTYNVNPSTFVVEGYKAVANGTTPETWTVKPLTPANASTTGFGDWK